MNIRTLALVAFLMVPAGPTAAQDKPQPVRLEVTPRFQLAPLGKTASVSIRVTVPQSPQNRVVCVEVDGPVFRSSCWESSPTASQNKEFRYSSLEAGSYVATARLFRVQEDGKRIELHHSVEFLIN
jgi:hypothetical protein